MSKNKKNNEEWKGFCGCPICEAMKDGTANTSEGLKKAFDEAEKKNLARGRMTMRAQNKNDLYYDAMDAINVDEFKIAEKLLNQALSIDPDYVQTYIGFASLYGASGKKSKARANIEIAFEKTLKLFPKWPKKMEWGDMDNRAYMRAVQYRADLYGDDGEKEKAIELYRLLLKLNPGDNQGVRYTLAGLYAGISGEKINKMFDEGNETQNWSKLEKLVKDQNKIHRFWKEPRE